MPTFLRRKVVSSLLVILVIFWPSMMIWPEVGCSMPLMSWRMVDLPEPLGPVRTRKAELFTVKLILLRAVTGLCLMV